MEQISLADIPVNQINKFLHERNNGVIEENCLNGWTMDEARMNWLSVLGVCVKS